MNLRKSIIIINPIAGRHSVEEKTQRIKDWLEKNNFQSQIEITKYPGNASEIAIEALKKGFNHFIIIGGDGTINEVASYIYKEKDVSLAIIPSGSGNGLALHLNIPKNIEKSIEIAFGNKTILADIGLFNEKPFFSVSGIGFDAYIANKFSKMHGRGINNYIKAVLKNYPKFKPLNFEISCNNEIIKEKALMISFANSNQFGNNTSLSPKASITDGLIDMCIMKKIPASKAILMSPLLFLKKLDKTKYLKIIQVEEAEIKFPANSYFHTDGEPYKTEDISAIIKLSKEKLKIHVK